MPLLQLPDSTGELESSPDEWYSTGEGVKDCPGPCEEEGVESGKQGGHTGESSPARGGVTPCDGGNAHPTECGQGSPNPSTSDGVSLETGPLQR